MDRQGLTVHSGQMVSDVQASLLAATFPVSMCGLGAAPLWADTFCYTVGLGLEASGGSLPWLWQTYGIRDVKENCVSVCTSTLNILWYTMTPHDRNPD